MSSEKQKSSVISSSDENRELERKVAQIYRFCKADRKGDLTMEECKIVQNAFLNNEKIPPKKRQQCATIFSDLWKAFLGDKQSVTCEAFVENMVKTLMSDREMMKAALETMYSRMFHCVDFNDNAEIDVNEFLVFSEAVGFKDHAVLKKVFRAIDVNGNTRISLKEYIGAYLKYYMDESVKLEDLPIFGLPTE